MGEQTVQVSDLSDVLDLVQEVFQRAKDSTTIQIGFEHGTSIGAPPRVVFIPEQDPGGFGPPRELGAGVCATHIQRCAVSVRASETGAGDGATRLKLATRLAWRVLATLKNLGLAGIILAPGNPKDTSPLRRDAYGGELGFQFAFVAEVPIDADILASIAELTAAGPRDPARPEGDTGNTFELNATVNGERDHAG